MSGLPRKKNWFATAPALERRVPGNTQIAWDWRRVEWKVKTTAAPFARPVEAF